MENETVLPYHMDIHSAAEINFAISKFRLLSEKDKRRLADGILGNATNTFLFHQASKELFGLITKASTEELTKFINDALCGGNVGFNKYRVAGELGAKTFVCAYYFRKEFFEKDGSYDVPNIRIRRL